MNLRKQSMANQRKEKEKYTKTYKETKWRYPLIFFLFLFVWFLVQLYFRTSSTTISIGHPMITNDHVEERAKPIEAVAKRVEKPREPIKTRTEETGQDRSTCNLRGVRVYMYELPPEFNVGMLQDCEHLNIYTNMCSQVVNRGLGWPIESPLATTTSSSDQRWFATHQFLAEMIYHARVENHPCRTRDPNEATLFYVPFYGGLYASSKFREVNHTARDELGMKFVEYMQKQPMWWRNGRQGLNHFLVLGRTSWDFMRNENGPDFGANSLLNQPVVRNMSVLTVERNPWNGENQIGIPYPSYFHPYTVKELDSWRDQVRKSERPLLFSFIGAPRKGVEKAAIRDELIRQCNDSNHCLLVKCGPAASQCHEPLEVVKVMKQSEFCLQAPGDSFTRRSTFDSILTGCIPVFLSPHTAYTQYAWYLPQERSEYSVFIDEKEAMGNGNGNAIEQVLLKISNETKERMRSNVIDLIPKITYANPNCSHDLGFNDAVDVSLMELANLVRSKVGVAKSI